jgi:hypothetical protein
LYGFTIDKTKSHGKAEIGMRGVNGQKISKSETQSVKAATAGVASR